PGEREAVRAGPRLEILEVEAEDVVALDHVGIPLADDAGALLEERPLVEPVSAHDVTKARRVGERDRDDPVPGARSARELVAFGCHHLDVEGEAAEIRAPEPTGRSDARLPRDRRRRVPGSRLGRRAGGRARW